MSTQPPDAAREPTYRCEWCGESGITHDEIIAYRARKRAVMMCAHCCPEEP